MVNAVNNPKKELVYSFPLDASTVVLHVNGYSIGVNINFSGDKRFLIAACGMCTFAIAESVAEIDSITYAQALLIIMLCLGLAHIIVLDKDSKFHTTFAETCQLMNFNVHTISGENHNLIIVERVNRYLNKGTNIFLKSVAPRL